MIKYKSNLAAGTEVVVLIDNCSRNIKKKTLKIG